MEGVLSACRRHDSRVKLTQRRITRVRKLKLFLFFPVFFSLGDKPDPPPISCFSVILLCAGSGDVREIILHALDAGLLNGDYAFFTVGLENGKEILCLETVKPYSGSYTEGAIAQW